MPPDPESVKYHRVLDEDQDSNTQSTSLNDVRHHALPFNQGRSLKILKILTLLSLCLNLLLGITCTWSWATTHRLPPHHPPRPKGVYSPAQHVVEYDIVVFNDGFTPNGSIYMVPPTDEGDAAWRDLWAPTLFAEISDSEARLLPNKTVPLTDSDNHHIVGLDIFHQLHCLDSLRQSLRPERYSNSVKRDDGGMVVPQAIGLAHWDHCIEVIRQNLMCSVDISPVSWEFKAEQGRMRTTTTDHVCRKWEPIKKWAEEHIQIHFSESTTG